MKENERGKEDILKLHVCLNFVPAVKLFPSAVRRTTRQELSTESRLKQSSISLVGGKEGDKERGREERKIKRERGREREAKGVKVRREGKPGEKEERKNDWELKREQSSCPYLQNAWFIAFLFSGLFSFTSVTHSLG